MSDVTGRTPTIRGPAENGRYLVGFLTCSLIRSGSIQRSGLNSNTSSPQSAEFRCIRKETVEIAAPGGRYRGGFVVASVKVESWGGITTPCLCLVSLEAIGTGGNSRSVSLNTAFTAVARK